jgi:hypothetical protein
MHKQKLFPKKLFELQKFLFEFDIYLFEHKFAV